MVDDRPDDILKIAWKAGYLLSYENMLKVIERIGFDYTDEEVIDIVKSLGLCKVKGRRRSRK